MKKIILIIIVLFIYACNENAEEEKSIILSSVNWTMVQKEVLDDRLLNNNATYRFFDDGRYELNAGDIKVFGTWSWVSNNEIYLQLKGLTLNDEATKFNQKSNKFYIKVLELNEMEFKTLERNERDSWDSEFVKEVNYIPNAL